MITLSVTLKKQFQGIMMAIFDFTNQTVTNQYNFNVSGDVNFGAIQDKTALIEELRKLQQDFNSSDNRLIVEAGANVEQAVLEAEKTAPNKLEILSHMSSASLIVAKCPDVVEVLNKAIDNIKLIF